MAERTKEQRAKAAEHQRRWRERNPEKVIAMKERAKAKDPHQHSRNAARWRRNNPERAKESARQWQADNREKTRDIRLRYRYNITKDQWDALFASQGHLCAICRSDKPGYGSWHTDHCHDSGKVRGILCHGCNTGIGNLKHDVERLLAAVGYIRKHS